MPPARVFPSPRLTELPTHCLPFPSQTATAAVQTVAAATPQSFMAPPAAARPLHVSKERLSLKAQVIFESSWKKIEEKYKDVSLEERCC